MRGVHLFAALTSLALVAASCDKSSSNNVTPVGDGGSPAFDSGPGGDDAGDDAGGDAGTDAAAGPCSAPASGYHAIGTDITNQNFVALYSIGKGADDWDVQVGRVSFDGLPAGAPPFIALSGSTLFAVNAGGVFSIVLPATPLDFKRVGTYVPGGGLEMIAAATTTRLVLAMSGGEVRCLDLPNSVSSAGFLPLENPPIIVGGLTGVCAPLSGASGSYDLAGVDISGPLSQFKFFKATLGLDTAGAYGTLGAVVQWPNGSARGVAEAGTVTLSRDASKTPSLIRLDGAGVTVIRPLRLCAPGNLYHGKPPPVSYLTD
jgi:hypothetical protein